MLQSLPQSANPFLQPLQRCAAPWCGSAGTGSWDWGLLEFTSLVAHAGVPLWASSQFLDLLLEITLAKAHGQHAARGHAAFTRAAQHQQASTACLDLAAHRGRSLSPVSIHQQ